MERESITSGVSCLVRGVRRKAPVSLPLEIVRPRQIQKRSQKREGRQQGPRGGWYSILVSWSPKLAGGTDEVGETADLGRKHAPLWRRHGRPLAPQISRLPLIWQEHGMAGPFH
jgi:hypothetical protein